MQYHRVVATAGISGLAPQNLPRRWLAEHAADVLSLEGFQVRPADGVSVELAAEMVGARWRSALPEVVDARRVGAEYSTLHALRAMKRLGAAPSVELIHSDTFDGALAAVMLRPLLERDFAATTTLRRVAELSAERPAALRRSLGAFMEQVARSLREGEPGTTCFAPIGGYKVMTALGYLAGAYLRYPTAYLHENAQILHEVPWVPIQIDDAALRGLATTIRRAAHGVLRDALEPASMRALDEHAYLFERAGEEAEEIVFLNAFGHFLRAEPRYRALIGTRVIAAPDAAQVIEARPGFVRGQVENLLGKLTDPARNQGELFHEKTFGHREAVFHLYKGASNGQVVFRAAWRYEEAEDTLRLARIWDEHDGYERDAAAGRGLLHEPASWRDVTESLFSP